MSEAQDLSLAIQHLYDAALDHEQWAGALQKTTEFVEGASANLFWQDAISNTATVFHTWNTDPHYDRLYRETYAPLNPYFPALAFVEVGKVVSGIDLMPHEEFRQTRFYLEWVKPQGLIDVLGVNLDRSVASTAFFSIARSETNGVVDDQARRRCKLIAPHVKRAVVIGKVVQHGQMTALALKQSLEGAAAGVIFVAADGRIMFANQRAEEHFQSKKTLQSRHGIVSATDLAADRVLKDAVAAAERGDQSLGLKGIDVQLGGKGNERYVAQVLSLVPESRRRPPMEQAVAALFVRCITVNSIAPLDAIAKRYRLTPTELRVLAAVIETGGVEEIAARLGIAKATVKTHLNHVLSKTGKRSQADLVRLMVGETAVVESS